MPVDKCVSPASANATGARARVSPMWTGWCPRRRLPDAKPVQYRVVELEAAAAPDELPTVLAGLAATPATLPPRYFYDELGCALYGAICLLPEYYPTRTEAALFREA